MQSKNKNVGYTFSAAVRHREKLQCPAANHKKILNAAEMGMQSVLPHFPSIIFSEM